MGDFHFESALIAAVVGSFWGGISSSRLLLKRDSEVLLRVFSTIYIFGAPLFLFSLFTGCLTFDGFGFWILTPVPSVFFGVSIGRFYRKLMLPFPMLLTILSLLFVAVGVFLVEFFTLPQVYFFNHVWGAWPGPIYDETVRVTGSFVFFRTITLGWIILFWFITDWKKSRGKKSLIIITSLLLFSSYFTISDFQIITPRSTLKTELKYYETEHFDLYYSGRYYTDQEIEYWSEKHEFYFQQIVEQLEIDWPKDRKIESYLYANAWQKKELVGAKFTSYVPIWLEQDQLHIAKEHLERVLKHELVHVLSKQFGNSLFNGSWSIGLIEGLAEGIAEDASPESTLDQILAADLPYPTASEMKNSLSLSGFYSSASSISYTTAGSFVRFLLENYPVSNFKEAYKNSSFDGAYKVPFDSLVANWKNTLPTIELDSLDREVSNVVFSQRSIFQKSCPHVVSPVMELWDQIQLHETNKAKSDALPLVEQLYEMAPQNLTIKQKWLVYQLEFGNYEAVINTIETQDSIPLFTILKADAYALSGDWELAYDELETTLSLFPNNLPSSFKYSFDLRSDTTQWSTFNSVRYFNKIPFGYDIADRNLPNQLIAIQKAIELNSLGYLAAYSSVAFDQPKDSDWFGIYELLIDRLIFIREFGEAQRWMDAISELQLRPRYLERLQEQQEWLVFLLI